MKQRKWLLLHRPSELKKSPSWATVGSAKDKQIFTYSTQLSMNFQLFTVDKILKNCKQLKTKLLKASIWCMYSAYMCLNANDIVGILKSINIKMSFIT